MSRDSGGDPETPTTEGGDDDERRIAHGFAAGIGLEFSRVCKNCNNDVTPTFLGYDAVDAVCSATGAVSAS